jgi:hypothetical protein
LAKSEGWRKVAGETSVPSRSLSVIAASPARVAQASSEPPLRLVDDGVVVVRAEEGGDPAALAGLGDRHPVLPGDVLLALDHQIDLHQASLVTRRC